MYIKITIFLSIIVFSLSCNTPEEETIVYKQVANEVSATLETDPVRTVNNEDAADDPAIWVDMQNPENSKIIGTDKKSGLCVYNMKGKEIHFYPVGRVNNADVRYGFKLSDNLEVDVVGASNRSDNSITLMSINKQTGELEDIAARKIISNVNEVYGFCFYHNLKTDTYYAIIGGKDGTTEQWRLFATNNKIDAELTRTFKIESQTEGMVADDEFDYLYIGEEDCCIWKVTANPESELIKQKVAMSDTLNPNISFDIEGLALYYAPNGKGYLIASIQGSHTYAIFKREGDNEYICSFSIENGTITDGAEETDGIDVTNLSSGNFSNGIFVVQDGFNFEQDSLASQNFKFIAWDSIAKITDPPLITNNSYDILH